MRRFKVSNTKKYQQSWKNNWRSGLTNGCEISSCADDRWVTCAKEICWNLGQSCLMHLLRFWWENIRYVQKNFLLGNQELQEIFRYVALTWCLVWVVRGSNQPSCKWPIHTMLDWIWEKETFICNEIWRHICTHGMCNKFLEYIICKINFFIAIGNAKNDQSVTMQHKFWVINQTSITCRIGGNTLIILKRT